MPQPSLAEPVKMSKVSAFELRNLFESGLMIGVECLLFFVIETWELAVL